MKQNIGALMLWATLLALSAMYSLSPASDGQVEFDISQQGKIVISIEGSPVADYVYRDAEISRPYFADVHAPGSPQITRTHPPLEGKDRVDHGTLHPGLWMSFGDVSGNDYWRLAAAVVQLTIEVSPENRTITVVNRYLSQENQLEAVCEEACTYTVVPRPRGFLLLWDSTFSSDHDFYFGDQEEMGIGFRVATPIRVERVSVGTVPEGNGTLVDSEGRVNGSEIWGNTANWCDFRGILDGQLVGMALFCHPENFRPSWFHARDYGLLVANPFGRAAFGKGESSRMDVKPGEKLRLRYGVLVHASPQGEPPNLAAEYSHYLQTADQKAAH